MRAAAAYYNEHDQFAAAWLRELIREGLIPRGEVDERSIVDVRSGDLEGYTQHHFFAGIGGWPLALRLAGWDDARPVWTGSCPCQPGSAAGKRKGFADERDLWPVWLELIQERHPAVVFGEQVAAWSAWLGRMRSDLEAVAYAVGCMPIEAASAGSHQLRDRYWFVAYDDLAVVQGQPPAGQQPRPQQDNRDCSGALAGADRGDGDGRSDIQGRQAQGRVAADGHGGVDVVDVASPGWGEGFTEAEFRRWGSTAAVASVRGCQFIECPDGKWRALPPPRVRWLGNGISARVDKLRGFGNAIDPRPAAAFIKAADEAMKAEGISISSPERSEAVT